MLKHPLFSCFAYHSGFYGAEAKREPVSGSRDLHSHSIVPGGLLVTS